MVVPAHVNVTRPSVSSSPAGHRSVECQKSKTWTGTPSHTPLRRFSVPRSSPLANSSNPTASTALVSSPEYTNPSCDATWRISSLRRSVMRYDRTASARTTRAATTRTSEPLIASALAPSAQQHRDAERDQQERNDVAELEVPHPEPLEQEHDPRDHEEDAEHERGPVRADLIHGAPRPVRD